ncbi:MAG: helix-turn-helix domain-containing protein [Bacillota bacterium]
MMDELLGERIKKIRKQRNMTLQDLSDVSGLSIAFISKVERGLTSPTFSALLEISKSLEVDLVELVDLVQTSEEKPVIKKNERIQMCPTADGHLRLELGTQGSRKMKGLWITLQPGATDISIGHPEEEVGAIIRGRLQVTIGKDTYVLEEGDTLYIGAHVQHSLTNIGDCECVCFFAIN